MRRASQHADVRASAEYPVLARFQHNDTHLGMFKPHPLNDVGKLDIDAKIVGVEFQLIAAEQAARLIDIHHHARHRPIKRHTPMAIARRLGLKFDHLGHQHPPDRTDG